MESTTVGTVSAVYRYAVKSLGGERLEETEVSDHGVVGDRAWAVRDEVRGGIRGAKKIPALMTMSARYASAPTDSSGGVVEIELPDGDRVRAGADDASERLSRALDHEVTLWPLLPATALDHYRRGAPTHGDIKTELREIFGRTADEPLPDLSLFPTELIEFESPPGSYFDAYPILLITQSSLDYLQSEGGGSQFDVRRFRPNFVIDTVSSSGAEPFPELAWRGKKLRLGEALLDVTIECPRCVMTTHGFGDLPKDPRIMRTLVQKAGGNLGVYAKVSEPGRVCVADKVELLGREA